MFVHDRTISAGFSALYLLIATVCASLPMTAQPLAFPEIQRRYDAVVLVADVPSGRLLGGVGLDRAFEQRFRPASVFKLVIAASALRSGSISPQTYYRCTGLDTFGGVERPCWNRHGHGRLEMSGAIAHSCNLYFRSLAERIPSRSIVQTARSLGLLLPSGFRGSNELPPRVTITDDNLLGEAFRVSPAQMLRSALILARRGGRGLSELPLGSPRYRPLYLGMRQCVANGTARSVWSARYTVAGKTGTDARFGSARSTAGWFIGFAPIDRPRFAVAVMLPNGRGSDAAIVARSVLQELL